MNTASWHFFIPAPEPLPVEDGYTSHRNPSSTVRSSAGEEYPSSDSVTLLFHQIKASGNAYSALEAVTKTVDKRTIPRFSGEKALLRTEQLAFTIVEVVVSKAYGQSSLVEDEGDEDAISVAFDFAVEQLNIWLDSLSVVTGRPYENIRREALPPVTIVAEGAIEPWRIDSSFFPIIRARAVLNLNCNLDEAIDHPDPFEDLDESLSAALMSVSVPGPFVSYFRLFSQAQYYFRKRGEYAVSVILFASACEALFDELLQHLLWESGKFPYEAVTSFLNKGKRPKGIVNLVENTIVPILGVESCGKRSACTVANWKNKVARLRNLVIHSAYQPDFNQVHEAEKAVAMLVGFLADQIFALRVAYPITALAFLGHVGLKQRGDWKRFSHLEPDPGVVNIRMKTFRRWSQLVAAHREAPSLYGAEVGNDVSYAVVVIENQTPVEAFVVNETKIVAKRVDLVEARGFPAFERHFENASTLGTSDRVAVFSTELERCPLPKGAQWDLYAYEVMPWDLFQFSNLENQVNYDFSAFSIQ